MKLIVWIDCQDCGPNSVCEGRTGTVYGMFAHFPERQRRWALLGRQGTCYSIAFTPERFGAIAVDLFETKRRRDYYIPDFELVEETAPAPVSQSTKTLPPEPETVHPPEPVKEEEPVAEDTPTEQGSPHVAKAEHSPKPPAGVHDKPKRRKRH